MDGQGLDTVFPIGEVVLWETTANEAATFALLLIQNTQVVFMTPSKEVQKISILVKTLVFYEFSN